ncbi:coiled-coil domain-containing protein 33 [Lonchura striata]
MKMKMKMRMKMKLRLPLRMRMRMRMKLRKKARLSFQRHLAAVSGGSGSCGNDRAGAGTGTPNSRDGNPEFPGWEPRISREGNPEYPGGVGNHRLALQRMAGDLLSLRRRLASLEAENGHLRHSLARLREPAQLRGTDLDVLTRDELLDRLATLARELAAGTAELRALRDRVQRLQNELIRKNDREKELVLLQRRHQQQQLALSRCQHRAAKAGALERALQQQEKVIEAMERLLREKSTERAEGATTQVPLAQTRRLLEEPAGPPRAARLLGATEKLELLARLEEAQGRARVLESTV